jgi:hypothetical protein
MSVVAFALVVRPDAADLRVLRLVLGGTARFWVGKLPKFSSSLQEVREYIKSSRCVENKRPVADQVGVRPN